MTSSTKHLYILTGASRGMGLAMAEQLADAGHALVCISRKSNAALAARATAAGAVLEQWEQDLADPVAVAAKLQAWLAARGPSAFASATLINNAGMIPRIAPISDIAAPDISAALRVGLEAPMLLSGAFLRGTADWAVPKKLLSISSGLGRRAMASQSPYCAAKAGMDHFSRCVALEEAIKPHGAKVCSLAPGVIDTDMQVQLRGADSNAFPDIGNFIGMKDKGQLSTPADAGARVLAFLDRADFGTNPVADVRDPA